MKKIKPLVFGLLFSFIVTGCASSGNTENSVNLSVSGFNAFQKKALFAHRGLCSDFPENTMEAFQEAYDKDLKGIELDVRFTKDEIPVIFHDKKLKRMSSEKASLSSFTFEELRKIRIGDKKQRKNDNPVFIPSFEEYCSWGSERKDVTTIIELKSDDVWKEGHEDVLIKLIEDYGLSDRVIFASFEILPLQLIKEKRPELKCSFITDEKKVDALGVALDNSLDCVSLNWKLAKEKVIKECHRNNILVNVWTADSYKKALSFFEDGIDLVTGNF